MKIAPEDFWDPGSSEHPPLTNAMLAKAERRLGVTLPAELVALLRAQNGGYTRGFAFPTHEPTSWAEDHVLLDELFGIGTDGGASILDTAYMTEEWGLPPGQVLLSGDGHWWITLDYRAGAAPSVAWIDVEVGEDLQLAPSFADFLAGLLPGDAFD